MTDEILLLLNGESSNIDISSASIEAYSSPEEAQQAYESGEYAAIISNRPYEETYKTLGANIREELDTPVFSAEPSPELNSFKKLIGDSNKNNPSDTGNMDIYGLMPTLISGIENSPIGVTAAIQDEEGDYPMFYINQGFEELTGYERGEVLGEDCKFLQGEDTEPESVEEIRYGLENSEPVETTIINYTADGEKFCNRLEIWPTEIGEQEVFLGYQKDITETENYRRDLELLTSILRHDLANDSQVISGNIDFLKDRFEEVPKEFSIIEKRLNSIDRKVEKMRQMNNPGNSTVPNHMNLYQKMKNTVNSYEDEATSAGFEINLEEPDEHPFIKGRQHLEDYFGNMLENSIEHSNGDRIGIKWDFYNEKVEVEVSDNGVGMDTSKENWGIGMLTIHKIADNENIDIELDGDDGITFTSIFELLDSR